MKPKLIHQEAMENSFKAKQALEEGNYASAFKLYKTAAGMESQVAEFYFDKPELEPTRSVIIRSAAFLNLKAGLIGEAQKFIFFGLLHTKDELIRSQLNNALELSVSMKNMSAEEASSEYNYLNILRQKSIHYILEPSNLIFGHSVSLLMIKEFTESYLKSLKAFAVSKFKNIIDIASEVDEFSSNGIENIVNPLVTGSAYGSFKFSIANDFLERPGEKKEIVDLKSNIINNYHNEIFTNPLTEESIEELKAKYDEEDVNDIFRPLIKIKANNSPYKVGYYDTDNYDKVYLGKIVNKQKNKLFTIKPITKEDIGELESSIIHKRSSQDGKVSKKTIFREQLKSYESEIKMNQIESIGSSPLILNEEILISMNFNSSKGFTFIFNDFNVEATDIEFNLALKSFQNKFYTKIISLVNNNNKNEQDERDFEIIKKLIGNPDALKR